MALFRDQVGPSPKTAAMILRCQRATRLLAQGEKASVQVAAVCCYADQSHLTREFTRLSGGTPAALRTAP